MYRIRLLRVEVSHNNARIGRRLMFIAERRVKFLCFKWWWQVMDADYRDTRAESLADVEQDIRLRKPLPPPEILE